MSIMSEYELSKEIMAVDIPLEVIYADSDFNCRGMFGLQDVAELANDIQEKGVLQPIIVMPYEQDGYSFKVIAGHRRFKACQKLNRKTIPSVVRAHVTEVEARSINLIENIKRSQLNIMQEATALKGLLEAGMKESDIPDYLGMSTGWTQPRLWLLKMPESIQKEAAAGFLNTTHIRELSRCPLISDMEKMVIAIKEAKARGEKLDVTAARRDKAKYNPHERKARGITDILKIQTAIRESMGNNLATKLAAYAIGQLNDAEMYIAIKEECDQKGINYKIPEEATTQEAPKVV